MRPNVYKIDGGREWKPGFPQLEKEAGCRWTMGED